ncbi:hypothetical protein F0562_034562 [Nyssa sinensis]|uniref:Bidirectional sugar transporter SWEET n=1 Tax=Nyssa sinensis TaxID=561372 RepID=A0A5J5AIQ0_9ASTE|nr:hypothetical protein F0562_034562 [Nyssa sinensis]
MAIIDHHPLLLTFGVLGNIVSISVYFAPLPTFIQIYKRKSTLGFQSLPYVVSLFSAMLWMYYAFLKSDAILLISINLFGCVVETIYIIVYFAYASREARVRNKTFNIYKYIYIYIDICCIDGSFEFLVLVQKQTGKLTASLNAGVFCLILVVTLCLFEGMNRIQVVGWACVVVSVSVFAAPLSIVFKVVRTRSVEFMPFTLSFFLTLSAIMWFAYGLLLKDLCIAVPNVFGFFLGLLQMLLYGIYRNSSKKLVMEKKLAAAAEQHIINIVMLGTPEVHPVDAQISCCAHNIDIDDEKKSSEKINDDDDDDEHHKAHAASVPDHEPCSQLNAQLDSPVLVMCASA